MFIFPSCTISIKWINKNIQGLENSVGLCQVWIFAQSLRLGEEVEQKPLFWLKKSKKNANLEHLCMQKTERWAAFRGRSFEAKALASVCASLAQASFNLLCKRVVCRVEGIQFPLTCCFIPQSQFFFWFFCPLFTCTTPQRGFWPECMEK